MSLFSLALPRAACLLAFALLLCSASLKACVAQTYDAASQFADVNPNGVWSYGGSDSLGSAFVLDPDYSVNADGLDNYNGGPNLGIEYNPTDMVVTNIPGAPYQTWQPGALGLHPGSDDQPAIVRFTAPFSGNFSVNTTYYPIDSQATTDVHVLVNSVSMFDSSFSGSGPNVSYGPVTISLQSGDTVDFAVGDGGNGYSYDATGLSATITNVTPPTITSFTPTSGPVGTVVTVTGTNLGGVTAVRFHNANATVFSANSAGTQLTVTVPAGAATGTITITTPGGSVKTTQAFTVVPAPTITSFTPTSGPVGTMVTITGTNLKGTTAVRFHNANATAFSVNAAGTQLTVTVPSGAGTGTITVTTPAGSVKTATNFMVIGTLPTVKTLTFNPTTIAPGGSSTGTVTLSGPAPSGGAVVTVTLDSFTFDTVTIAAGQTTGTFTAMAASSAPAGSYVFAASYNASAASATLTVN